MSIHSNFLITNTGINFHGIHRLDDTLRAWVGWMCLFSYKIQNLKVQKNHKRGINPSNETCREIKNTFSRFSDNLWEGNVVMWSEGTNEKSEEETFTRIKIHKIPFLLHSTHFSWNHYPITKTNNGYFPRLSLALCPMSYREELFIGQRGCTEGGRWVGWPQLCIPVDNFYFWFMTMVVTVFCNRSQRDGQAGQPRLTGAASLSWPQAGPGERRAGRRTPSDAFRNSDYIIDYGLTSLLENKIHSRKICGKLL